MGSEGRRYSDSSDYYNQEPQQQSRNENYIYTEHRGSNSNSTVTSSRCSTTSNSSNNNNNNDCWTVMQSLSPSSTTAPNNNQNTQHQQQHTNDLSNEHIQYKGAVHRNSWNFMAVAAAAGIPSYQRNFIDSHYVDNGHRHITHLASIPVVAHSQSVIANPTAYKRYFHSGKSSNSKDICGDDKHNKEDGDPWNVDAPAAFLGPNLWDRTLPYDTDLKVHPYVDLDEFLSENCMPSDGLPSSHLGHATSLGHRSDSLGHAAGLSLGLSQITKRERSPSPSDCMSPDTMNPPSPAESIFSMASGREFDPENSRAFSDEDLKPQPMIKKSRKQFVPDEMKDDKYWARRRKNNMAAKRSRDARRMKENQIALRAGFLEKENMSLHRELEQLKQENMELRARLSKYQDV